MRYLRGGATRPMGRRRGLSGSGRPPVSHGVALLDRGGPLRGRGRWWGGRDGRCGSIYVYPAVRRGVGLRGGAARQVEAVFGSTCNCSRRNNPWQPTVPEATDRGHRVRMFVVRDNHSTYAPLKYQRGARLAIFGISRKGLYRSLATTRAWPHSVRTGYPLYLVRVTGLIIHTL